jgi:hypothetical protein
MSIPMVDPPLLELTDPALARPLPAALARARADVLSPPRSAGHPRACADQAVAVEGTW